MRQPEWLVIALGATLLFPLRSVLDAHPHEDATVVDTVELLAPLGRRRVPARGPADAASGGRGPARGRGGTWGGEAPPRTTQILPVLALGYGGSAADLLEVQATTFLLSDLEAMQRMDARHLLLLYRSITELDPADPGPFERGAIFLSAVADRPDLAIELLQEGIEQVPPEHRRRWRLHWELASTYLLSSAQRSGPERRADVRRAGRVLMQLSDLPGVPPERASNIYAVGERLFRSRGELDPGKVLRQEERLWTQRAQAAEEEVVRERARERLAEVRSAIRRRELQALVDRYTEQRGRPPHDLEALGADGTDPLGAGFFLQDGEVVAPGVEARRLERQLVRRTGAWSRQHGGETPSSLADLGVSASALPPWLEVALEDGEVTVTVVGRW